MTNLTNARSLLFTTFLASSLVTQAADVPSIFGNRNQAQATASNQLLSHLQRAARLIGKDVLTSTGQKAGRIDDLIVDLNSGQVLYALLATAQHGQLAVAPPSFTEIKGDTIRLNVDAQKLLGAPPLAADLNQSGQLGQSDFVNRLYQYYGQSAPALANNNAQRFSALKGREILDATNQKIGNINNLVVSMQAGRVVYIIMSPGQNTPARGRLLALPPGSVTWNADRNSLASNISTDRLGSAPYFSNDNWKTVASQGFATKVSQFYNTANAATAPGSPDLTPAASATAATSPTTPAAGSSFGHLERGRQLIGQPIQTRDNRRAGKLDDLVVDLTSGHLLYAIVDSGSSKLALPPGAFAATAGNLLRLAVDTQKLSAAPKFTTEIDQPSQINKADFVYRVYQQFGQSAWWQGASSPSAGTFNDVQKVSQLPSKPIINVNDAKVAAVQDVILNVPQGRILYVVISPDPSLNLGSDYFALPPSAITWNESKSSLASNLTKEQLASAPKFVSNNWSQLTDPAFASRVYQFYGKQPWFSAEPVLQPTGRDGQSLYPRSNDSGNDLEL